MRTPFTNGHRWRPTPLLPGGEPGFAPPVLGPVCGAFLGAVAVPGAFRSRPGSPARPGRRAVSAAHGASRGAHHSASLQPGQRCAPSGPPRFGSGLEPVPVPAGPFTGLGPSARFLWSAQAPAAASPDDGAAAAACPPGQLRAVAPPAALAFSRLQPDQGLRPWLLRSAGPASVAVPARGGRDGDAASGGSAQPRCCGVAP